ncbi:MAG: dihydrofolate reductase family protein, partial [Proteobacteria bacterium]|nr:dihydrofolate reductase family protein [Pseudomonadota bacterium]
IAGELASRGLTRVLVEGGGVLAAELLGADLVDRLAWFRAPLLFGGDGVPAAAAFGVDALSDAPAFARSAVVEAGPDMVETYCRET